MRRLVPAIVFAVLVLSSQAFPETSPPRRPAAEIPGVGEAGGPGRALSPADMERWLRGRALFDRDFHQADGLGAPDFNADSCRACHQDPVLGGSGGLELNVTRFGWDAGGRIPFEDLQGGQVLHKFRLPGTNEREEYDPLVADVFEQRQSPSLLGAGRIDAIAAASITANEDPTDANGDGIVGVARRIEIDSGGTEIGRFGWKAQIPRLRDFVNDACGVECGLTTPDDGRGFAFVTDADTVSDPEMSTSEVDDLAFYLRELGPPRRRGSNDPRVAEGEALFSSIGCALCHVPALKDGAGQDVFLYSDLLLHGVMKAAFRGVEEPGAAMGVYRTPPLWGIGSTAPYLHDGRAETLREAIAGHTGEAAQVVAQYGGLSPAQQEALVLFLEDL